MTGHLRRALRVSLLAVAFACGLCAIALLSLPLLLALLMMLFDSTAQGVMVLLGAIAGWFRWVSAGGGGGLPMYRSLALDPAAIALAAVWRMAPCVAGLVLAVLVQARGRSRRGGWWAVAGLWGVAALVDGRLVGVVLAPGVVASVVLAVFGGPVDRSGRLAA